MSPIMAAAYSLCARRSSGESKRGARRPEARRGERQVRVAARQDVRAVGHLRRRVDRRLPRGHRRAPNPRPTA